MIIKKAILHIMNCEADSCMFSQSELDISDYGTGEFIEKHLSKILSDSGKREGVFLDFSTFKQTLERYLADGIDFNEFSQATGTLVYDWVVKEDEPESMDFLVCRFTDEQEEYVALLLLPNQTAFTHAVEISEEGGMVNKIIRSFELLPGTNRKISSYALIRLRDLGIFLSDKKRVVEGDEINMLQDKILQCMCGHSDRETVRKIKKITGDVAEKFGANPAIAVSRAKQCIVNNAEQDVPFTPSDICEEVFYDNQVMKQAFREEAIEENLPAKIKVENEKVVAGIRNHKIKTDTGIEIKVPTEYLENDRYVEFINNPDGTFSIQIKNIGKILNR